MIINFYYIIFYIVIIFIVVFFIIQHSFIALNFDNFQSANIKQNFNWQNYLKNNWKIIQQECFDVTQNSPITFENRNKYWDEIDKTNVKNKWLLGHESVENTWLNYGFIIGYDFIIENCEKCPQTYNMLKTMVDKGIKIKVAGFSWLRPNSYIPFHTDPNDEVVYHLGLFVPEGNQAYVHVKYDSSLNKNDDIIYHKNGHIITFNDNNLHSAVNKSNRERIILYLLIE